MADIDLKTETPDATLPSTGFLFGADSQAAASPSVYSTQAVATALLGSTSLTGATITADAPVLNLAQTWNNAAVTFTGMRFNVPTDSSAAGSLLMDLQVGGSSRFSVRKNGIIRIGSAAAAAFSTNIGINWFNPGFITLQNTGQIEWVSGSNFESGGQDLFLSRKGAANLRLGAADVDGSPVAQILSVQSTAATTTSNNVAGANFTITGSQGTGQGAGGSIIFQVAPAAGSSGNTRNALATALTINSARDATFEGGVFAVSSSQTAVAFGRNGSPGTGIYFPSSINLAFAISGNGVVNISASAISLNSDFQLGWRVGGVGTSVDTILARDAANTLALRNSTNAQTFNVYNTFTDASNYERLNISWSANVATIQTQGAGTGATNRRLDISSGGQLNLASQAGGSLFFFTNGSARWYVDGASGHFLANTDNAVDIGASGATRPRSIYVGTDIYLGQYIRQASNLLYIVNGAGILQLSNASNTDFGRLQFGGTTSSFPALKRSSTVLQARLADDSDFAPLQGQLRTHNAYTAGAPTATGYIVLYDSTGTAYKVPAEAL